jgi:hypothetical protein
MHEINLALLKFLDIDPGSAVTRVEVVAVPNQFPVVTVTRFLDHSIWDNETRMFKLVPYSTPE